MESLNYDFNSCVGRLFVADEAGVDMSECIKMFERVDEKVRRVVVIAGQKVVAMHERASFGGWKAFALDD